MLISLIICPSNGADKPVGEFAQCLYMCQVLNWVSMSYKLTYLRNTVLTLNNFEPRELHAHVQAPFNKPIILSFQVSFSRTRYHECISNKSWQDGVRVIILIRVLCFFIESRSTDFWFWMVIVTYRSSWIIACTCSRHVSLITVADKYLYISQLQHFLNRYMHTVVS